MMRIHRWTNAVAAAVTLTVLATNPRVEGQTPSPADHRAAIERVVGDAYVDGVFRRRRADAVRAGFDPAFTMTVLTADGVVSVGLAEWLERLGLSGQANPRRIDATFVSVDVTGDTAVVKLELREDGRLRYTDYLGLYRRPAGWRIVNKVFQGHQ